MILKNFGSFSLTGEEHFLRFINGYKLDYSLDIGANTGKYSENVNYVKKNNTPDINSISKFAPKIVEGTKKLKHWAESL